MLFTFVRMLWTQNSTLSCRNKSAFMLMLEKPEEDCAWAGGNVSVPEIWTPTFCFVNSFNVNSFQQLAKLAKRDKIDATHWVKPHTWLCHHVNQLLIFCYCWKTKYRYASNSAFQFVWGPFRSLIGTKEFEVLRFSRSIWWNENCFCVGVD